MCKETRDLTVAFELDDNADVREYEADVRVVLVTESDYGADADGNRGMSVTFVDDVIIDEVRDIYGKKVSVTDEIEKVIGDLVEDMDFDANESEPYWDDEDLRD
jgi:predicted Ser/Thr protein kinase